MNKKHATREPGWLPEIVHLPLTALEAGWLTGALLGGKINDVKVHVRGATGEPIESTMCAALIDKLNKAWEKHD